MNGQFEIFKSAFLQKQPQLAKGYPCGHCACTHEVYIQTDLPSPNPIGRGTEGEGSVSTIDSQVVTIESLCRCDPPTCRHDHVTLTRADVELWSLNWTKLARALCHAFSLNYQFADLRPCNTRQIGSWSADAVPVILTIQSQRGFFYSVITELIARLHQKFILLAPTAKHFDAGCQELLANANAAFFPLDSNVILNPNGVLECVKEPSDLFSPISVPMLSPRSPDSVRRDSKFKVHGSTFDVRAAGPVPSPLATHNSLSASGGEGRGEVAPPPCNLQPSTRYCLRKGMGIWKLIFDGHETDLKHERGIFYVAWLLYHPPAQPIHALDLIAKIPELYRNQLGLAQITNPENGKSTILQSHARIQERNLALDDAQALRSILKKQQELEAILDDENESEPVKQEALRELESIVQFQKQHGKRSRGNAQRAADSVRKAITRFHQRLLRDSPRHQPSTINSHHSTTPSLHRSIPPSAAVLAKFAAHLEKHLLIPSRRYSGHGNAYARSGLAGCFTYEPPANSVWET
jgi:hypothetical protein